MEFQPKMPTLVAWKSTSKSRKPKLVGIGSIFRAYRHGLAERKLNQAHRLILFCLVKHGIMLLRITRVPSSLLSTLAENSCISRDVCRGIDGPFMTKSTGKDSSPAPRGRSDVVGSLETSTRLMKCTKIWTYIMKRDCWTVTFSCT